MELFGPDFERYEEVQGELNRIAEVEKGVEAALTNAEHSTPDAGPVDKSKAKKGKVVMKSTGLAYQFQILQSIGVPHSEIKNFADPLYWLSYFPPTAMVSTSIRSHLYKTVVLTICYSRMTTILLDRG